MNDLITKSQAFMFCTYGDQAPYITEKWLTDKSNIKTLITLLQLSLADDLKALAHGIADKQEECGIESNVEFDFVLMFDLQEPLKGGAQDVNCQVLSK